MKYIFVLIFSIGILQAQEVQWASKVIAFSSEKKGEDLQFKAIQVLGAPNVLPNTRTSACAWSATLANNDIREEYLHVGFNTPISIRQVLIAESFNAGSVSQVFAYDTEGNAHLVYKSTSIAPTAGGLLSIKVPATPYKVASVKVNFATNKVKGENQIDAIGISDSEQAVVLTPLVVKNATKFVAEPLGAEINSPFLEANPVMTPNGKRLYFIRQKHPENIRDTLDGKIVYKQDIWYADKQENGSFSKAINVGPPLNNRQHNAAYTIGDNESFILLNNLYLPNGFMEKGLSIAYKTPEGKWGVPTSLLIQGFKAKGDYAEFWLDKTGNTLIMSVEGDNCLGGNDLYVSFKKSEGVFSQPLNMGNILNTAEDEATPFLDTDNKTLYFASRGFTGFGDFDIFVTKRLDDTWLNWSPPENMGGSINTSGMDIGFSKSGFFGYFSSKGDIFQIRLQEPILLLSGKTLNGKDKTPVNAPVSIQKILKIPMSVENTNGNYKAKLDLEQKYLILVEVKGFFPYEEELDVSQVKEYTELNKDLLLVPLEKDQTLRLDRIYFARGESQLLGESAPQLDKIVKLLQENTQINIRLEGHTEIFGNKKALKKLSKSRVLAVKKYLTSKGIRAKRLKYKAFGAEKPLSTEDTEKARQLNRRVEIRVI